MHEALADQELVPSQMRAATTSVTYFSIPVPSSQLKLSTTVGLASTAKV